MKPSASPLALLLIFALAMPALPARAAVPRECKATAQFDAAFRRALGSSDYLKVCEQAVKDLGTALTKARSASPRMTAPDSNGETQWGAAQDAADLSKAGAQTQAQRKAVAQQAALDFYNVALSVDTKAKKFAKDDIHRLNALPAATSSRIYPLAEESMEELSRLRNQAINLQGQSQQAAANFQATENQLTDQQLKTQQVADGLKQGNEGVGSGTWVALGGAALIAAGTVGGIAYFGNRGLKKLDKMADQKIEKAGDEAKEVIKEAEEAAKRIIEFASNKANTVLANAEQTVKNIIEKAKKEGEAVIEKIGKEIQEQFENLSTSGLEKLRKEMANVFEEAIAKAKNSGDTKLAELLTKARDQTLDRIQKEIDRRNASEPKSTVPSTNTATSTSTATSTQSSSSTATSTSSTTATASNPVTTTSTSTSTSIRQ